MTETVRYPRLIRRLLAAAVDGVILACVGMFAMIEAADFGISGTHSLWIVIATLFVFEPLLVSVAGGTIGHHLYGLRVKSAKIGKRINLFAAVLRFIIKNLFFYASMVFILITQRHQAMHDGIVGSVVVMANPEQHQSYDLLTERNVEQAQYRYPSLTQRIGMIFVYNLLWLCFVDTVTNMTLSEQCLNTIRCTQSEMVMLTVWQLLWLAGIVAIILVCWKGLMFGCRRQPIDKEE